MLKTLPHFLSQVVTCCLRMGKLFCILLVASNVHAQVSTEKIQNLSNALENLQRSNARAAEIEREQAIADEVKRNKERVLKEKFRRQLEKIDNTSNQLEKTDNTANNKNPELEPSKSKVKTKED